MVQEFWAGPSIEADIINLPHKSLIFPVLLTALIPQGSQWPPSGMHPQPIPWTCKAGAFDINCMPKDDNTIFDTVKNPENIMRSKHCSLHAADFSLNSKQKQILKIEGHSLVKLHKCWPSLKAFLWKEDLKKKTNNKNKTWKQSDPKIIELEIFQNFLKTPVYNLFRI